MKRWTQLTLALVAVVPLVACAGDGDRETAAKDANPPAVGTSGTTNIDRDFIADQIADGQAEVELARLAQQRAANAQVKEFAQMMVRDHTQAASELKQVAAKHNIQPATGDHNDHNDVRERLGKLKGAEFDREYINAMVDDHQKAVSAIEDKADDNENSEVKQWAAKTLPTVRQHLERAKQLKESLDRRGTNNQ
jgi:putative membrane protein